MKSLSKVLPQHLPPFYHPYLQMVGDQEVLSLMEERLNAFQRLWSNIPAEKYLHAYAPGKWTIQELLGHITDTERIMAYRALCIARGEIQALPGFDENAYVVEAGFNNLSFESLLHSFQLVRQHSLQLFAQLPDHIADQQGTASGRSITVRGLACVIAGHEIHHSRILQERYL
jgi:hypothetical protein